MIPVDAAAVVLLLVGATLLIAELFTPTLGLVGLVGGALVALGAFLLVDPDGVAGRSLQSHGLELVALCAIALAFAALAAWKVRTTRHQPETSGAAALVGRKGRTVSEVTEREGRVRVDGELWEARSAAPIKLDVPIRVQSVDGLVVRVQPDGARV